MAYGTKYRATAKDQLGRSVHVDFQLDGYAGGVTPVRLAQNGLKRRWGKSNASGGSGATHGLKPQLRTYRLSARDLLAAEEIATTGTWRAREFVGGSFAHQWEVIREEAERPTDLIPQAAEISARCGLGRLSEVLVASTYAEAEALLTAGPQPLLWWLLEALSRTSHALELEAILRRVPTGKTNALEEVYARPERWIGTTYNGNLDALLDEERYDVASASWYDVAADVVGALGAVLGQQGGRWRLVERPVLYDGSEQGLLYETDAHLTATPPQAGTTVLLQPLESRRLLRGGSALTASGVPETHVTYDPGTVETMFPRSGWSIQASEAEPVPEPGRVLIGPGGSYVLGLAASISDVPATPAIRSPLLPFSTGSDLALSFKVRVAPNARGDYAFALVWRLRLETGTQAYVLMDETNPFAPPGPKWVLKAAPALFDAITTELPVDAAVLVERAVPALPAAGTLRFEVLACFDNNGELSNSGWKASLYASISEIKLLPEEQGATTYAARITGADAAPGDAAEGFDARLGTGPSAAHPGCLLDSAGASVGLWKPSAASSVAAIRLAELEAYARLEQFRNVRLEGRVAYRITPASPCLGLDSTDGKVYQWVEGEADDLDVSVEGTAAEVRVDSLTISVVPIKQVRQGSFGAGGGDMATTLARVIESQDAQLARIAQQNAIALVQEWAGPGIIDTLYVETIETPQEALRAGRKILVVDRRTGKPYTFTMRERQTTNAISLAIEPYDLGPDGYIAPDSGVYPLSIDLLNIQTFTAEATYNLIKADALCELSADTTGTVTTLAVTPLREAIADGTLLAIQRLRAPGVDVDEQPLGRGGGEIVEVYADGDHDAADVLLSIRASAAPGSGGVAIEAGEGAAVRVSGVHRQTESIQTAYEITQRVRKDEIVSEMSIQFDRIAFDTYRVCSENWDGTVSVDGNGVCTIADPGTQGWCLTNSGQVSVQEAQAYQASDPVTTQTALLNGLGLEAVYSTLSALTRLRANGNSLVLEADVSGVWVPRTTIQPGTVEVHEGAIIVEGNDVWHEGTLPSPLRFVSYGSGNLTVEDVTTGVRYVIAATVA